MRCLAFGASAGMALAVLAAGVLLAPGLAVAQTYQIVPNFEANFPDSLKPAVEYAASRWSGWLTSSGSGGANDLEVTFGWHNLGGGTLGQAGPSWIGHAGGLSLLPAQYMLQTGGDLADQDGTVTLNSRISWYEGTDGNVGPSQIDVVSVALHELGHQMGMFDSYIPGSGWGYWDSATSSYQLTPWDAFLRDQDNRVPVARPGPEFFDEVGTVSFTGPAALAANAGNPVNVYAPNPFKNGSSLSHVDQSGETDAMMYYAVSYGQARHGLYDYERGAFTDLGWSFVTPAQAHAFGTGSRNWHNGSAWQEGLPPVATTSVYLDAAGGAYSIAVRKDVVAAAVALSGSGTLELRGGTLSVAGGAVSVAGSSTLALRGGSLSVGSLTVGTGVGSPLLSYENVSGSLTVADLLMLGPSGRLNAVAGSTIRLRGDLGNHATSPADLAGLANVNFILEGGSGRTSLVEAAGQDLGAVAAGWTNNFALGSLTLGGADVGRARLTDDFDNRPPLTEALYVATLQLNPGAALDAGPVNLYYLNGGPPKRFFNGDVQLDGDVDFADYQVLEINFGRQSPEPGTLAVLALCALPLLGRRRNSPCLKPAWGRDSRV